MALLPSLWRDMDDFYYDPWRLHRELIPSWRTRKSWLDDFGYGLHPHDLDDMLALPREFRKVEQRFRDTQRQMVGNIPEIAPIVGKSGFQVCVDVQQFKPEEVRVRADDQHVTVMGKHEERQDDHGFISRQFTRRFDLPPGFDPSLVTSELSNDGVLIIKALPSSHALQGKEHIIPIECIDPAPLNGVGKLYIKNK